MTITEFLEARIAEDEAEATPEPGWENYGGQCDEVTGVHYDSARVLAECGAKRAIIASLPDSRAERGVAQNAIIEALAAVYKDHPDYKHEWSQ